MNGILSVEEPATSKFRQERIPNSKRAFIAVLSEDFHTNDSGAVFYRESFDVSYLSRATNDVRRYMGTEEFNGTHVVVITYSDVTVKRTRKLATFQAVLVSDGDVTYVILYYKSIGGIQDAVVGYSNGECDWNWFRGRKEEVSKIFKYTNTGYMGQYIFPVSTKHCINSGKNLVRL